MRDGAQEEGGEEEGGKVDNAAGWRHIYPDNKIGYESKIGELLLSEEGGKHCGIN